MMEAPEGTCNSYERHNPPRQPAYPNKMDSQMIFLKLCVNRLAVICGRVSNEMASTMPIIRRQATMVRAMNIMSIYSKKRTGRCCERANSRSNAMYMMGLRKMVKNSTRSADKPISTQMSVLVMVSMLPKRKADKSGAKPGDRKLKMMPIAIPNVQKTAMAESSRMSSRLLSHSTPKADRTAKIAADKMGEMPVNYPIPIPPNEAWVMPPLIKTRRRVTI